MLGALLPWKMRYYNQLTSYRFLPAPKFESSDSHCCKLQGQFMMIFPVLCDLIPVLSPST
jgi:hypothetical protein